MKLKPKPIVCNLCGEEMVVEEYADSTLFGCSLHEEKT